MSASAIAKICVTCNIEKPIEEFYSNNSSTGGHKQQCISCIKVVRRILREKYRNRTHIDIPNTRRCGRCGEIKPSSEFYRNRNAKDGLQSSCKDCYRTGEPNRSYKYLYGITFEDKLQLIDKQNGKCAICYTELDKNKSCVDHDHETGIIRGILCAQCNLMLGLANDSAKTLVSAADYLLQNTDLIDQE
jgi:hypothetical protein